MRLRVGLALVVVNALLGPVVAHALSAADKASYHAAFALAQKGAWKAAARNATRANDPLPREALHWLAMVRGADGTSFNEVARFMVRHPDWPGQDLLEQRAEEVMDGVSNSVLSDWFANHPPITATGKLREADLWFAAGRTKAADELVRRVWIQDDMSLSFERSMYQRYHAILRVEDHEKRLDRLLWNNHTAAARRLLSLVPPGPRAVAEARLALITSARDVEWLVKRVPLKYRDNSGLLYDRVRWRQRKNLDQDAIDLLLVAPSDPAHAAEWADEREIMARRALAMGRPVLAFHIAEQHSATNGRSFTELEFLAGWIALRFLNEPKVAYDHFVRLYDATTLPITTARGAYWAGRAAEALGHHDRAASWFNVAAQHFTTYYGQLAASASDAIPASLPPEPQPSAAETASFDKRKLVRLTRDLADVGADEVVTPFFHRLCDLAATPDQYALVARLARDIGRPDLEIDAAKRANDTGVNLLAEDYPIPRFPKGGNVEMPLLLAMTRQESAFEREAVSRSGARGLMQLMPRTASIMARILHVRYSRRRLTTDRRYNMTLGRAYLNELLANFSGSYVLAIAAYNAGPARVKSWISQYGDPRSTGVNVIDWIESIPYSETRNYVQRVFRNLQIYRFRLGETDFTFTLASDLKR